MDFDLNLFTRLSEDPYLSINNQIQVFKLQEKKNNLKIFSLLISNTNNLSQSLNNHLQCQSHSKRILKVKGCKMMHSSDAFGFKVERSAWLTEEIQTTLINESFNDRVNISQLLEEIIELLAELEKEDIALTSLTPQIIIKTIDGYKIIDVSSAINVLGMESSVNRQIVGNTSYYDPETYNASLRGESFIIQNYFKSSVYSLGLIILETIAKKFSDRRYSQQEIDEMVSEVSHMFEPMQFHVFKLMLLPERKKRPSCIELKEILQAHDMKNFQLPFLSQTFKQTMSLKLSEDDYTGTNQFDQILQNQNFKQFIPHETVKSEDIDFKFTQSQVKDFDQTINSTQIQLPESLRRKIIQYQQLKKQSDSKLNQFNQNNENIDEENLEFTQNLNERNDLDDSSQDYIVESSSQPLTFTLLQSLLMTVQAIPFIPFNQIKLNYNSILGQGTEGSVFQCSVNNCQNLAVKQLKDIDNQQAFELILTISQLQLRKIKGIFTYDYYSIEPFASHLGANDLKSNLYLVSRRMKCDLGQVQNLKLKEKFNICNQIARVLVELNQLDMMFVHGDLKPSNILLDAENNIYIIDFGMSNMIQNNFLVKSTSHTYLYSPPEQVNQQKVHSKSDIWSFGVIIYELFTNKQISKEFIIQTGVYDESLKGCIKYKAQNDIISQSIEKLVEKMTLYDYQLRLDAVQVLNELERIIKLEKQQQLQPTQNKLQPQKSQFTLPQKTKIRKGSFLGQNNHSERSNSSSGGHTGLMVKGVQMKVNNQVESKPYLSNQPSTTVSRQQSHGIQGKPPFTQITKFQ